ncbi:hypothetical protein NXW36_11060 [Bacteroides fragilis]|nr:hypothetical protein NXW36_11060 [Bacteroides fragilis]
MKGGDSVSFLMSAEGMTFNDALDYLAKKFNVILDQRPVIKKQPAKKDEKRQQGCQRYRCRQLLCQDAGRIRSYL